MNEPTLKQLMLAEADTILKTVDWLEKRIDEKLIEFEVAVAHNNYSLVERLEVEIYNLNKKLTSETKNMDRFMEKYRRLVDYEKKAMVSYLRQKEQTRLRSLSAQQRRSRTGS